MKILHYETVEAIVGESVRLPCIFNDTVQMSIAQIEWRKKDTKLVVHHKDRGTYYFHQDVKLHPETDDHNKLLGSYLYLQDLRVNNSGTYFCEFITYPQGKIGRTTHLNVKGKLNRHLNKASSHLNEASVLLTDTVNSLLTVDFLCVCVPSDAEVTCDHNSTLEVGVGENVTVHCELRLHPQAQYRWLKVGHQQLNGFHFIIHLM